MYAWPLIARTGRLAVTTILLMVSSCFCETQAADELVTTPGNVASLRELERQVGEAAMKAIPCVVAVETASTAQSPQHHEPSASGVIISADGLILSQYHVSHLLGTADHQQSRKPGERIKVVLHDGSRVDAELLGADRTYDVSLLRLVKPGPYSFAPLDGSIDVKVGDWVLKLGHPMGYRYGREPVVRLGRVLCEQDGTFFTDCSITGGDSGGPFFNLDGRLVGIVRNSAGNDRLREAAQGRVARSSDSLLSCTANALVSPRLESMQQGEFLDGGATEFKSMSKRLQRSPILDVGAWTQGVAVASVYRHVVEQARLSLVSIGNGADARIRGTIVGADGWIITKASELPAEPMCQLPDGRVLSAEVSGVEPAFDIALLKIQASGLHAVEWADNPGVVAGTLVATPGAGELPLAVGIVSVARRDLSPPFPTTMTSTPQVPAGLIEIIGSAVQGRGYWVEYVEGRAAAAGIKSGDVIIAIGDRTIRSHQDLATCIAGHWAGEQVPVRLLRAGNSIDISLPMRAEGQSAVSSRNDDFPTIFEHDMPLRIHECGGPVVGLDGKAIGITIAPVGPHGCMATPADCLQRLMPDLRSGKLAANWKKPKPTVTLTKSEPNVGRPVTLSRDDLKLLLTERHKKFKSLLVEYEVVTEANVAPRLLMEWNLHHVRDFQELHRIAFAGNKQYSQITNSGAMIMYAPQDEVFPDPLAPQDVAQAIEQQRLAAANRKQQGGTGHLYMSTRAKESCYIFDGSRAFQWYPSENRKVPTRNDRFSAPIMYLAGLGLRPLDPQPDEERLRVQHRYRFPDNFALYDQCDIHPVEEFAEGVACVVLEGHYSVTQYGKRLKLRDKIWLDPKLDFAPRRWQQYEDGTLQNVRTNANFEEITQGCWLPRESSWSIYTPPWVGPEFRNQPAYAFKMRLRVAHVNDISDEFFKQP